MAACYASISSSIIACSIFIFSESKVRFLSLTIGLSNKCTTANAFRILGIRSNFKSSLVIYSGGYVTLDLCESNSKDLLYI